ncbi:MAG: glycosyltransferase [Sporolactobacillus sp.]|jgi:glycosyltransferase involved in cell wall biosynthesis|nr:glycosyltransferase [Sporolactobacillus sp.]
MKILHVCEYVRGGITTYLNEIIRYQVGAASISSVHILMSRYNSDRLSVEGAHIHYYKYKRNLLHVLPAMIQIDRAIRKIQPDIIHIHSSFAGLFVRLIFFFRKKRPKIVYCAHGWSFLMDVPPLQKKWYGTLERLLARRTDRIIDISQHEWLGSQEYRIPKEKSIVIPNGIDSRLQPVHPVELTLDPSKLNLLFVGRLDRQKGIDILIRFFSDFPMKHVRLYVIGQNVLDADRPDMLDQIIPLGWIDHRIIDNYYRQFDAVIIPSRWEGFGLVAVEAMKNKKAVIASRRGDLPDLIIPGVNGCLFDLDYPRELAHILSTVSRPRLQEMGEQGFKLFKARFTSDKLNRRLLDVYEQLVETRQPAMQPVTQYGAK